MNFFGASLLLVLTISTIQTSIADDVDNHFVNEWVADIPGGIEHARSVAEEHGYKLVTELRSFPDHYMLERSDIPHRSRRSASHHTKKLTEDDRVRFVEQQQQKTRVKRGMTDREIARDILARDGNLDDPAFGNEWYLNPDDTGADRRETVRADLRVREVWKKGITGKGVVVTILDDGLEADHPDLLPNFDKRASYDFNDHDDDPTPRYDPTNENKHGTRCAGEVAMVANNGDCGVGIAFDSKIGGARILDGRVTDRIEGDSLSFNRDYIDIYSASWGPNDDGKTCEAPGLLAQKALEGGVKNGRGGKGSIFIWASGNGGHSGDNCNNDGYTSSIWTISVSSATQSGKAPWYAERCSSTLTTTYSSGSPNEGKVVSADLHHKCTDSHTGTSAAAPMAAGVMALLLEANPNITWRDAQHIVVHTSRMEPLALEGGWYKNGAGYCVNLAFGFGLMDAMAMVELADPATWKTVGEQKVCRVEATKSPDLPAEFVSGNSLEVEFHTDGCKGQDSEINFLEHVQVIIDVAHEKRGNIYAELESPMGTITPIMLERKFDTSNRGFRNWALTTTHNWGENPQGTWKFRVADRSSDNLRGSLKSVKMILYGTTEQPEHQLSAPKDCGDLEHFVDTNTETADLALLKLHSLLNTQHTLNTNNVVQTLQNLVQSLEGGQQQSQPAPAVHHPNIQDFLQKVG